MPQKYWFQAALLKPQPRILVSACLLGEAVRYDGGDCIHHLHGQNRALMEAWYRQGLLLPLCPEVAGGLAVPRPPAEIVGDKVVTQVGDDVTAQFKRGAEKALDLCLKHKIQWAILKQGSPSCGHKQVNDGSFTKNKIKGQGVTASLLLAHGIQVFDEYDLNKIKYLL